MDSKIQESLRATRRRQLEKQKLFSMKGLSFSNGLKQQEGQERTKNCMNNKDDNEYSTAKRQKSESPIEGCTTTTATVNVNVDTVGTKSIGKELELDANETNEMMSAVLSCFGNSAELSVDSNKPTNSVGENRLNSLNAYNNVSNLLYSSSPLINPSYMQSFAAITAMMNAAACSKQRPLTNLFNNDTVSVDGFLGTENSFCLGENGMMRKFSASALATDQTASNNHSSNSNHNNNNNNNNNNNSNGSRQCTSTFSATSSSPLPNDSPMSPLSCAVCGDISSGKHYGILACNGCSGFFKRSVRRRLIYRCQAGTGTCVVDKAHRNQCQACRLKKCLSKGMNKDAVQNERQPRNTATIQPPSDTDLYSHVNFFRECSSILSSTVDLIRPPPPQLASIDSNLQNILNGSATTSTALTPSNSLADKINFDDLQNKIAYLNGKKNGDESPSDQTEENEDSASSKNALPLFVADILSRIFYMAIKWAKSMPPFTILSINDQTNLLDEAWPELFLISAFQWSLSANFEGSECPLFLNNFDTNNGKREALFRSIQNIFERFKLYALDQGELACLKAIILFRPEVTGLQNTAYVEGLQDQAQIMLQQHINRKHPSPSRFGRLLLLLPLLRAASATKMIENTYLTPVFGSEKTSMTIIAELCRN